MYKRRKRINMKQLLCGALLIVVAAGVVLYIHHHDKKSLNLAANKSSQTAVTGTPSKPTPHQVPSTTPVAGQSGGITDQNGKTSGSLPPSADWVSSTSGNITLQQPSPNTTVNSGDTLSGLSKDSTVQFILSDNSVGLIAQGNLNVVNGKFSGVLQFTPHSGSGKLEIYHPNPTNGAEEDIIEIDVNFNVQ